MFMKTWEFAAVRSVLTPLAVEGIRVLGGRNPTRDSFFFGDSPIEITETNYITLFFGGVFFK